MSYPPPIQCPKCLFLVLPGQYCSNCSAALPQPAQPQHQQKGIWESMSNGAKLGVGCLGLVGVFIILSIISQIDKKPDSKPKPAVSTPAPKPAPAPKPEPKLNASVRFTGTQFIISNLDSFDWTDVKMEINGGIFSGGYQLKQARMEAKGVYTVGALQFADSDGKRFNPWQMKPQKFSIVAQTPNGLAVYVGGWE